MTRVIDVGAGHASITKMPGPHYMVFDAGINHRAEYIVNQMKALMGTDRVVDLMVISHTDADHLGLVPAIMSEFDVRMVLRTGLIRCNPDDDCQWKLSENAIREKVNEGKTIDLNLRRSPIGLGYTFRLGEAVIQMVSGFHVPQDDWGLASNTSDFRNAGSIVMRLEYDGKSILFTGDEFGKEPGENTPIKSAEKFMTDNEVTRPIKSDVLIAAHHGADDASSTDFLESVAPTFVILPAGGRYQHPRRITVKRMTAAAVGVNVANIFRTDLCDPPGPHEWDGGFVAGSTDTSEDDDIDIVLTMGNPNPSVSYVMSSGTCP